MLGLVDEGAGGGTLGWGTVTVRATGAWLADAEDAGGLPVGPGRTNAGNPGMVPLWPGGILSALARSARNLGAGTALRDGSLARGGGLVGDGSLAAGGGATLCRAASFSATRFSTRSLNTFRSSPSSDCLVIAVGR